MFANMIGGTVVFGIKQQLHVNNLREVWFDFVKRLFVVVYSE